MSVPRSIAEQWAEQSKNLEAEGCHPYVVSGLKVSYYAGWLHALQTLKEFGGDKPEVSEEEENGYLFHCEVLLAEAQLECEK